MSIAFSKQGDCSICSARDTAVRKRGRELICLSCCRKSDTKKQMTKSLERNAVRTLNTYQKEKGITDGSTELIVDLDRIVSKYVRLAEAGKDLKCECFTCGSRKSWTALQCGHYMSRSNLSLRWELQNLRPQCIYCNCTLHGNLDEFKERLESERPGITDWLYEQSKQVSKPSRDELKQLLFHFQQKLKNVETKLK